MVAEAGLALERAKLVLRVNGVIDRVICPARGSHYIPWGLCW